MNEPSAGWPFSVRLGHWLGAILVLIALGLGAYMVLLVANPAERFELTQTHKSVGFVILALTLARLGRRALTRTPIPEPAARSVLLAAKVTHAGLYLLLLLLPLSGWLMASTTPIRVPTVVFGLLEVPYPVAPNLGIYRLAHAAHIAFALLLASLIGLHVAAAMVHAFFWRDRTLARMFRNSVRNRHGDLGTATGQPQ
jgi:cytochrome b561